MAPLTSISAVSTLAAPCGALLQTASRAEVGGVSGHVHLRLGALPHHPAELPAPQPVQDWLS